MMVINNENIEEYLLLLIDGELSSAEEQEVMAFIETHNEYQALLDNYLDAKLDTDDILVFEDKESLLKPETEVLHFNSKRSVYYKTAAAVVAVLLSGIAFRMIVADKEELLQSIVLHKETQKNVADSATVKTLVIASPEKSSGTPVIQKQNRSIIQPVKNSKAVVAESDTERYVALLQPLPEADRSPLTVSAGTAASPEKIAVADYSQTGVTTAKPDGVLNDGNRMDAVNALLARVETIKDNIESKTKGLKNMTVAIRLGGREFTIGK